MSMFFKTIIRKSLSSLMILSLTTPMLLTTSTVLAEEDMSVKGANNTTTSESSTATANTTSDQVIVPSDTDVVTSEGNPESDALDVPDSVSPTDDKALAFSDETSLIAPEESSKKVVRTTPSQDRVDIPDPVLKQEILAALNLPVGTELTKSDMEKLTSLFLSEEKMNATPISDLSGLEYATNLDSFYIKGKSNLTDFSPLEQLTSLIYVRIQTSALTSANFPDLSKSQGIKLLDFTRTGIDNAVLPKITKLRELSTLHLDQNMGITTIEPLKELPNLQVLFIQFCGVTDFRSVVEFPALKNLAAFGQNTGRGDDPTDISRSKLAYDTSAKTVFIPFAMMPNRLTNFDGYIPPFTTSTSASNTYVDFNGEQLPANRLQITDQGITVLDVSEAAYTELNTLTYNARVNNPFGSYAVPEGLDSYAISAGTYLHQFNVNDDGAPVTVSYVDENGQTLLPDKKINGFVGKDYDVSAEMIPDYQLINVVGATSGLFSNDAQTVTFVYKKLGGVSKLGEVMVSYVDLEGNEIAPTEKMSGNVGDAYQTKQLDIKNYTFKEVKGAPTGLFADQALVVTYVYTQNTTAKDPDKAVQNKGAGESASSTSDASKDGSQSLPKTGESRHMSVILTGIALLSGATVCLIKLRRKKR